jgi:hypothetical protein
MSSFDGGGLGSRSGDARLCSCMEEVRRAYPDFFGELSATLICYGYFVNAI